MSLELRARAAAATMELFGFNPHQRRGPDGRFIKMADSELKRPRRPRKGAGAESPLYRRRREMYNEEVLAEATQQQNVFLDGRFPELERVKAMPPGPDRDAQIDQIADAISLKSSDAPFTPPTTGGPRPAARRQTTASRPPIDAPYNERRQALQRSVDTGAYEENILGGGAMGETRRFELADGTSAVYKRHIRDWDRGYDRPVWTKKDQTDAEELSAMTAAALGVRAPAVSRAGEEEIYMELVPGQIGALRWPDRYSPPKGVLVGQQGVRIGLLDTLIENADRHSGNYMVDDADDIYAIDHGMAFSRTHSINEAGQVVRNSADRVSVSGDFALESFISPSGNYYDNPLTPSDVDHVRRQVNGLRSEFEARGKGDWWQSMSDRLDRLALRANGDTPIY